MGVQSFGAADELREAVYLQQMLYAHGIALVEVDDAESEGIDNFLRLFHISQINLSN